MSERVNSSNQSNDTLLNDLSQICRSDYSLSLDGLQKIIERHGVGVAPNNLTIANYSFFHEACDNERVTEEIIRYLLECFPNAVRYIDDEFGCTPLHWICENKNVTLGMVQLLIDAAPSESLRHENIHGYTPFHAFCTNKKIYYDEVRLEILKLLLKSFPESVGRVDTDKNLPLHIAAARQSPEFCSILIDAYPGSERMTNKNGLIPFHSACEHNTVAVVKYFYDLYPESINVVDPGGWCPIHHAIRYAEDDTEVVQFLLECNPDALSSTGQTPLHIACLLNDAKLRIFYHLIDRFPDFVRHENNNGCIPLHLLCVNNNLDYEDELDMLNWLLVKYPESVRHTVGGLLPIHIAAGGQSPEFCRVLIEDYPGSERICDNYGQLPFHRACRCNTSDTVKYLYELYPESINVADNDGDHPIYCAIWGLKNRSNLKDGIEMVRFLMDHNPDALSSTGQTALHIACGDNKVTPDIVQLLIDAFPDSVRHEDNKGRMPLYNLCLNENLDGKVGLDILKLLLRRCPESVRHADAHGCLPIHLASGWGGKSSEFCSVLIEEYPGSERITASYGLLPFQIACLHNNVAAAKYLYQLYPESINVADIDGAHPIHYPILRGINEREDDPEATIEMVEFLVACDSNVALQEKGGKLPLHWVCYMACNQNTPIRLTYLKILQILYDAHPEAIDCNYVTSKIDWFCAEIKAFVNTQLNYARQAKGRTGRQMRMRDENGQVQLHRALYNNPTLGSVKLLVKRNPSTIRIQDNSDTLPLHVACQHCDCARVVEYLAGLDSDTLTVVDEEGNTALHHACRGAKHATILLLLEKFGGASISKRNTITQLPIHLLLESNEVSDREDAKYVESIYQLLRAYPETVIGVNEEWKLALSHSGKKRKFGGSPPI